MHVHSLAPRKPDRSVAPLADAGSKTGALPYQGGCAVTEPPFVLVGTGGEGEPQFGASFAADPSAISPVRRRLRILLRENGLEHVADDVALICQELMSNAVQHGCLGLPASTTLKIIVVWSDARLRAVVQDPSEEKPTEQDASCSRTSGRGLRLVDELSDRWGVETPPDGSGKAVWTELDSPRRRAS